MSAAESKPRERNTTGAIGCARTRRRVIARLKGGLGNQLFEYAAARRLALVNHAELVLDDVSGFARDFRYRRQFALDGFNVAGRRATAAARHEPFGRYRRAFMRWVSQRKDYANRSYLEEESPCFDARLIEIRLRRSVHIDGIWASERYFSDIASTIRKDLTMRPPRDEFSKQVASEIRVRPSVGLHMRYFGKSERTAAHNLPIAYYEHAVALMQERCVGGHYFVFSDDPARAREHLRPHVPQATFVSRSGDDHNAYSELWLLSQCRHFIIANSTFSWWGAWLGAAPDKQVFAPCLVTETRSAPSWNFPIEILPTWTTVYCDPHSA